MPLNEQDLLDLYEYRKSMLPQYEIRDHLPGFEKMEIRELWLKYGTEKMRWALRELGLHTGWKFRMLSKILDGSANVDYKPQDQQVQQAPMIRRRDGTFKRQEPEPQQDDGPYLSMDEIAKQLSEKMKKW